MQVLGKKTSWNNTTSSNTLIPITIFQDKVVWDVVEKVIQFEPFSIAFVFALKHAGVQNFITISRKLRYMG